MSMGFLVRLAMRNLRNYTMFSGNAEWIEHKFSGHISFGKWMWTIYIAFPKNDYKRLNRINSNFRFYSFSTNKRFCSNFQDIFLIMLRCVSTLNFPQRCGLLRILILVSMRGRRRKEANNDQV